MSSAKSLALPSPDNFGNYWFGYKPHGPAIFVSGSGPLPVRPGKFFASAAGGKGILMQPGGGGIRYFDTPEEALGVLQEFLS